MSQGMTTLGQSIWAMCKDGERFFKEKFQAYEAAKSYRDHFEARHGQVKVLGMAQPTPLRELYTAAQIIACGYLYLDSDEAMERCFRERARNVVGGQEREHREGISVANEFQCLTILGQPGAGKSTFLRRIGLEAALRGEANPFQKQAAYKHDCLPVFLELKHFVPANGLLTAIQTELNIAGFPFAFADAVLKEGKFLILLDGLDEVRTDQQDAVIKAVTDFVDQHANNRFILSCRTAFYRSWFTRFTDVALADFDQGQIASFTRNWFRSEPDRHNNTADALLERLRSPKHKATLELAATPLLLTFLCLVYEANQRLPANRASLYSQALDILLQKWAAEKRVQRQIYEGFTAELEIVLLGELAHTAFSRDQLFFTKQELTDRIREFLKQQINAPRTLDAERVLEAIEVHQGLLVQRTHNAYSFSHLTLQEYLTARHISEEGLLESTVREHLCEDRWREVFLLLANMAQSTTLLRAMVSQIQPLMHGDPSVSRWIRAAQRLAPSHSQPERSLFNRARNSYFALALALGPIPPAPARVPPSRTLPPAVGYPFSHDGSYAPRYVHISYDISPNPYTINPADAPDHDRATIRARSLARSLTDDYWRNYARDLAHNLAHDLARDLALAFPHVRDLAGDFARNLKSDLPFVIVLDFARARARAILVEWREAVRAEPVQQAMGQLESSPRETGAPGRRLAGFLGQMADALRALGFPNMEHNKAVERLSQVLASTHLIVECKAGSLHLKHAEWEMLCGQLLTVPDEPDSEDLTTAAPLNAPRQKS
jgi:hypothetical protein